MRIFLKTVSLLMIFIFLVPLSCCKGRKKKTENDKTIIVGAKHFTEQEILGEIVSILIEEKTAIKVIRRFNLGGTMICFNALRAGDIDLYVEYTGTGLVNILKQKSEKTPSKVYEIVKKAFSRKYDLIWLSPFGFNNTYTLTMRKHHAESLSIVSISDCSRYKDILRPGFDAEFIERPDGYRGLKRHYGFEFKEKPKQMDPGLMYKALAEKAVDIIDGFATDGRIPAYNLLILEDDKNFFPPYYAAPLIREEVLMRYQELKPLLNSLSGMISNETMQELNFKVDKEEKSAFAVAREFLETKAQISLQK